MWKFIYALLDMMDDKYEVSFLRCSFVGSTTIVLGLKDTQRDSLELFCFSSEGLCGITKLV